jgi:hypothetical protein
VLPPPLRGRVGEGGIREIRIGRDPPPCPSPARAAQGGRERWSDGSARTQAQFQLGAQMCARLAVRLLKGRARNGLARMALKQPQKATAISLIVAPLRSSGRKRTAPPPISWLQSAATDLGSRMSSMPSVLNRCILTNGKPSIRHALVYAEPDPRCPRSSVPLHDAASQSGREAG